MGRLFFIRYMADLDDGEIHKLMHRHMVLLGLTKTQFQKGKDGSINRIILEEDQ